MTILPYVALFGRRIFGLFVAEPAVFLNVCPSVPTVSRMVTTKATTLISSKVKLEERVIVGIHP